MRPFIFFIILFLSFAYHPTAEASAVVNVRQQRQAAAQRQAYMQALRERQILQQQIAQQAIYQQNFRQQQEFFQQAVRSGQPVSYLEPVGFHSDSFQSGEETIQMSEILSKLEYSSEFWDLVLDPQAKAVIVSQYIQWYQQNGVRIQKSAEHYVQLIDTMVYNNRTLLQQPFKNIVKLAAIMEYDFDNGHDKDGLARQFLGDTLYLQNKQRLGL